MKTPSFIELKSLVEYFNDELLAAQLQDVQATEEGLVLMFYRFTKDPRIAYLVFDLDPAFPFVGIYNSNPWPHLKKVKPVGLFLNSHAKNLTVTHLKISEQFGRVLDLGLGPDEHRTEIEFRMIPKYSNLIVTCEKKSISWYPRKQLLQHSASEGTGDEVSVRSIPFMLDLWFQRRAVQLKQKVSAASPQQNPYEKWKQQKAKDLIKKKKAVDGIRGQIQDFLTAPWVEIGQHLKTYGMKNLEPAWLTLIQSKKTVSENIELCFGKAKAAKLKTVGAEARLLVLEGEILTLHDLSELAFQKELQKLSQRQMQSHKTSRAGEGRYRKMVLPAANENHNLTCYMGKSAKDNSDLLRKSKAWDYWVHLKDYPSAYAIIHRQKTQSISTRQLMQVAEWLVKESLKDKKSFSGLKFAVVYVECRHVRPIKGDKLGRVTYHEARELLIAL